MSTRSIGREDTFGRERNYMTFKRNIVVCKNMIYLMVMKFKTNPLVWKKQGPNWIGMPMTLKGYTRVSMSWTVRLRPLL